MSLLCVVVDVETTGFDPTQDEIIEVGLCRIEEGTITARFNSLLRPSCSLPLRVKRLTGIDETALASAPRWREIAADVSAFIGDLPLVGHNIGFDARFLARYLGRSFSRLYDTCELARLLLPQLSSFRLEHVAAALGIDYPVHHRALADAEATAHVFLRLNQKFRELPTPLLPQLLRLLEKAGSPWALFFEEILQQHKFTTAVTTPQQTPLAAPESSAAEVPEIPAATDFFGPTGRLASILPGYEPRPQQQEMAEAVSKAFRDCSCLLVEAGTGTGKSLAYLIPAAVTAIKEGQRALIATYTLNLQEQLLRKDIPLVQEAIGIKFPVALVKGRQHYLCRRRWQQLLREGNFEPAAASLYARILVWLTTTPTGDFGELNLLETEKEWLLPISATAEGCLGRRCPRATECFVVQARRRAEKAKVIITNHALLFTDALGNQAILPDYGPLVIDEAHHLEEVATECLTQRITQSQIEAWLTRLEATLERGEKFFSLLPAWPTMVPVIRTAAGALEHATKSFFFLLEEALKAEATGPAGITARILNPTENHLRPVTEAARAYREITNALTTLLTTGKELLQQIAGATEPWVEEFGLLLQEGQNLQTTLAEIVEGPREGWVAWIEGHSSGGTLKAALKAAPVSVAETIHRTLFTSSRGTVLTSATLTVEGRFDHYLRSVGLDQVSAPNLRCLAIASPFAYQGKTALLVVRNLPLWQEVSPEEYHAAIVEAIASLATAGPTHTLALFTASRTLREVAPALKQRLEPEEIVVLAQGVDGGRTRLLDEFRQLSRAVLLGTASFWEGIDIPGGLLRLVVIVKLPFPPPEAPVLAARRALLAAQGEDDFQALCLPQAILRFKQGFGRLIRSQHDEGIVVVLDRRLLEKSYGLSFLRSLPPLPVMAVSLTEAKEWLARRFRSLSANPTA